MSTTMANIIEAVLPRLAQIKQLPGITIWQAATSIQSLIHNRLTERKSDLAVYTSELDLAIAAYGESVALPAGFIAMAEKPQAVEVLTDWMVGTVTSYSNTTGALVVNVTSCEGTGDTLADWSIATAGVPGEYSSIVGSSTTSVAVGTGAKSFTTQAGLSSVLTTGAYLIITSAYVPETIVGQERALQPSYLDNDDMDERWWDRYSRYGESLTPYSYRPQVYKIVGTTMYVDPHPIIDINITGKYFSLPTVLDGETDTIPWNGLFDEVFREGIVMIMSKGLAVPQMDAGFAEYIKKSVDLVVNSRIGVLPDEYRLTRRSWL